MHDLPKTDELERAEEEISNLKDLLFAQSQEIVNLKNENRYLRDQLEGKIITEQQERLLRMAKAIIKEYEKVIS